MRVNYTFLPLNKFFFIFPILYVNIIWYLQLNKLSLDKCNDNKHFKFPLMFVVRGNIS